MIECRLPLCATSAYGRYEGGTQILMLICRTDLCRIFFEQDGFDLIAVANDHASAK
jgi:hypothetical protein